MKAKFKHLVFGVGIVSAFLVFAISAQVPQPGITSSLTTTNTLKISITNGVATNIYEVYWTHVIGESKNFPWEFLGRGALGQTNFYVTNLVGDAGFFQVSPSDDWDGDGSKNDVDGQPLNPSITNLTIVIDFPTQNLVLQ